MKRIGLALSGAMTVATDAVARYIRAWVRSGDITLVVVLLAVALLLLVMVVVPHSRRY